jgi:hypothetical protein
MHFIVRFNNELYSELVSKSSNISRKLLSLLVGVTKSILCDVHFIALNDIDVIIYAN